MYRKTGGRLGAAGAGTVSGQRLSCLPYTSLTLLLLNTACPVLANSADSDQLADLDLHCFVIKYVNFYQKPRSSNLIGWKLEVGVALNLFSMTRVNRTTPHHTCPKI